MGSRHQLQERSPEVPPLYTPVWDWFEQQLVAQHFYGQIAASDHVGVTELVPYVTHVLPDAGMRLAARPGSDDGGIEQALYGIVRAGNHGFGLATAYSTAKFKRKVRQGIDKQKPRPGHSYITQINMDPHGDNPETKFIAPLIVDTPPIVLGGPGRLVPELSDEGLVLKITAKKILETGILETDQKRERTELRLTLLGKKLGRIPFQLLTATTPLSGRPQNDHPLDEVGTWAPYPSYVKRKLRIR